MNIVMCTSAHAAGIPELPIQPPPSGAPTYATLEVHTLEATVPVGLHALPVKVIPPDSCLSLLGNGQHSFLSLLGFSQSVEHISMSDTPSRAQNVNPVQFNNNQLPCARHHARQGKFKDKCMLFTLKELINSLYVNPFPLHPLGRWATTSLLLTLSHATEVVHLPELKLTVFVPDSPARRASVGSTRPHGVNILSF